MVLLIAEARTEMGYMGEQFVGKGRTVTEIGWKAVYGNAQEAQVRGQAHGCAALAPAKQSLEDTEKEPEPTLPVVSEGDEVEYLGFGGAADGAGRCR